MFSIPTLLTRNLHEVFGEGDPARRRAAIDEIFAEDCVFYDPNGGVYRVALVRRQHTLVLISSLLVMEGLSPFTFFSASCKHRDVF